MLSCKTAIASQTKPPPVIGRDYTETAPLYGPCIGWSKIFPFQSLTINCSTGEQSAGLPTPCTISGINRGSDRLSGPFLWRDRHAIGFKK